MRILCIDVGTGTQDILLFDSSTEIENCVQMVMPSPTQIIARRVRASTAAGKPLFLAGVTMGGGPGSWAVEDHIKQGLPVYALPDPARTFDDDLERVGQMGVQVLDPPDFETRLRSMEPEGAVLITMQDLDLPAIHRALEGFNEPPEYDALAVAVFDHGAAPPGYSDRRFRFDYISQQMQIWGTHHVAQALAAFAAPADKVHPDLTRLLAVAQTAREQAPGVPLLLMDTGPAALLGSLGDPAVRQAAYHNSLFVNVGNFHTLAFHIVKNRIYALFEHHTGLLDGSKLIHLLEKLTSGHLSNQEIFDDSGHGALTVKGTSGTEKIDRQALDNIIGMLSEVEGRLMQMRYGLIDGRIYTLEEAAAELGISRERTRQMETRILRKLRYARFQPENYVDKADVADLQAPLNLPPIQSEDRPRLCAVTGPRRGMLAGIDTPWPVYMAVPHGDMMLAGCFGLLRAFALHFPESAEEISMRLDV